MPHNVTIMDPSCFATWMPMHEYTINRCRHIYLISFVGNQSRTCSIKNNQNLLMHYSSVKSMMPISLSGLWSHHCHKEKTWWTSLLRSLFLFVFRKKCDIWKQRFVLPKLWNLLMLYVDIFEFNQFNIYTFRNRLFISDFCWLFVLAAKMVPTIRFLFPLFLVVTTVARTMGVFNLGTSVFQEVETWKKDEGWRLKRNHGYDWLFYVL